MWDHCSHMGGKQQHKHWLVFAVDARVIRFSWILLLNVVTMVNLFGVRMLPLLTDQKNAFILHKRHIFFVSKTDSVFSVGHFSTCFSFDRPCFHSYFTPAN